MSSKTPTLFGQPVFKVALIFEIISNISSIPALLFAPKLALAMVLRNPGQDITPAAELVTQVFGACVVGFTVPLLQSLPSPDASAKGDIQRGIRRAAYLTLGSGEVIIAGLFAKELLAVRQGGSSSWGTMSLAVGLGSMLWFLGLRGLFLYVKREWMDSDGDDVSEGLWSEGGGKKEL